MVSDDRQRIIETNRSLRLIKNELESLLEKGVITDDVFDTIHRTLPAEASLSGAARSTAAAASSGILTPVSAASPSPSSPPAHALANLNLGQAAAPPSYAQTTGSSSVSGGPPPLPGRGGPPGKPVLCQARALYKYAATDARDCSLERDDRVAVHEYMNADWWMGRNLRTGQEGIFPKNYVEVDSGAAAVGPNGYADEKAAYQAPGQPTYGGGGYPAAPAQQNPYNSSVPPMAVAEQGDGKAGNGKTNEYGKKFGKKLGNAAIFGAGATIGGNLVNSIF